MVRVEVDRMAGAWVGASVGVGAEAGAGAGVIVEVGMGAGEIGRAHV